MAFVERKFSLFPGAENFAWTKWFQVLLTLLSKFFSPFPRGTCVLSIFPWYLILEDFYLPYSHCITKQYYSFNKVPQNYQQSLWTITIDGSLKRTALKQKIRLPIIPGSMNTTILRTWIPRFSVGLFSLHSPLLRKFCLVSFPLLNNMLKFSRLSRKDQALSFVLSRNTLLAVFLFLAW